MKKYIDIHILTKEILYLQMDGFLLVFIDSFIYD